jgi:hypothetical protein
MGHNNTASGTVSVTLSFLGLPMECEADWTADRDGIEVTDLRYDNRTLDLGEVSDSDYELIELLCATDAAGQVAA